jgi:hypothetical protein
MAERLLADKPVGDVKKLPRATCLPLPTMTSRAAVLRAQRHASNSIATLRHNLGYQLIERVDVVLAADGQHLA